MKKIGGVVCAALLGFNACISTGVTGTAYRTESGGESEVIIQRAAMPIHSGFKEHIYIDGERKLVLMNGESGTIIVSNGDHVIHAELYTLTSEKIQFTANSNASQFKITPYSLQDFAIEATDGTIAQTAPPAPARTVPAPAARTSSRRTARNVVPAVDDNSVEGSLARAADTIMAKLSPSSKIAIVYVTSNNTDVTEFISNELEFIMVGKGFLLVDRGQLDQIRQEQRFQLSGEVDDTQAVSIGKMAGANIIITGAVTGTGNLQRLRLRALDTQSAQVLVAASERF
jgi:hypothetical protein